MKKYINKFFVILIFSVILAVLTLLSMSFGDNPNHLSYFENFIRLLIERIHYLTLCFVIYNSTTYYVLFNKDRKELEKLKILRSDVDSLLSDSPIVFFYVDKNKIVTDIKCSIHVRNNIKKIIDVGKHVENFEIKKHIDNCFNSGKPISTSIKIINNSVENYFSFSCSPSKKGRGINSVSCIIIDISEQKNMMKILRESESKFSNFINFIPLVIIETDYSGNILYENETTKKTFGTKKRKNIIELLMSKDDINRAKESFKKYTENNGSYSTSANEYRVLDKNGNEKLFSISSSSRTNEFGNESIIVVATDITDIKIEKEKLRIDLEFEKILKTLSNLNSDRQCVKKNISLSITEMSKFFLINGAILFRIDTALNENEVYSYFSNSSDKRYSSKDFIKYMYSLCIKKESLLIRKDSFISDQLKSILFEKLKISGLLSFRLKINEDVSYLLIYYRINDNSSYVCNEENISKIRLYSDILQGLLVEMEYDSLIKEKNETLNTLIDRSILGVISINNGKIIFINQKFCESFKTRKEDILNQQISLFYDCVPEFKEVDLEFKRSIRRGDDIYKTIKTFKLGEKEEKFFIEVKHVSFDQSDSVLITSLKLSEIEE